MRTGHGFILGMFCLAGMLWGCGGEKKVASQGADASNAASETSNGQTHEVAGGAATETPVTGNAAIEPLATAVVQSSGTPVTVAATPGAVATAAVVGAAAKKVYQSMAEITFKSGGNIQVGRSEAAPPEAAAQMKERIGIQPVNMTMQEVNLPDSKGIVFFIECASDEDALAAQSKVKTQMEADATRRGYQPGSVLIYGRFIVGPQATSGNDSAQYSKAIQELLD